MTKLETVQRLPSAAPAAVAQMQRLEAHLADFERSLAKALGRLESQQDEIAESMAPLLELRDQTTSVLTAALKHSKTSTDDARQTAEALHAAASQLTAAAQSLDSGPIWKRLLRLVSVCALTAALTLFCLHEYVLSAFPSAPPQTVPQVVLDSPQVAQLIIRELLKLRQQQQQ